MLERTAVGDALACVSRAQRANYKMKIRGKNPDTQIMRGERGGQVRTARFPPENRDQMLRFAGPQAGGSKDSATAKAQPQSFGGQ